jgi:hypothetical protein
MLSEAGRAHRVLALYSGEILRFARYKRVVCC